jgi:hypothetical protein
MGVALLAWGRFFGPHGERVTVPAPVDGRGAPWLLDFLATHVRALRNVGFTAIQLPPTSKAQGGAGPGCDGYGVFDPRDIGSKSQQGSVATRYGTRASLTRLVAVAHACDIDVYLDLVLHQRSGENGGPGVFRYLGADGQSLNGRHTTSPGGFAACRRMIFPMMTCRVRPTIFRSGASCPTSAAARRASPSRMRSTSANGCSAPQVQTARASTTSRAPGRRSCASS